MVGAQYLHALITGNELAKDCPRILRSVVVYGNHLNLMTIRVAQQAGQAAAHVAGMVMDERADRDISGIIGIDK